MKGEFFENSEHIEKIIISKILEINGWISMSNEIFKTNFQIIDLEKLIGKVIRNENSNSV